jgi:hypothetical protein
VKNCKISNNKDLQLHFQLGAESLTHLKKLASNVTGGGAGMGMGMGLDGAGGKNSHFILLLTLYGINYY